MDGDFEAFDVEVYVRKSRVEIGLRDPVVECIVGEAWRNRGYYTQRLVAEVAIERIVVQAGTCSERVEDAAQNSVAGRCHGVGRELVGGQELIQRAGGIGNAEG